MTKILNVKKALTISQKLQEEDKAIVLSGGCFDILHIGHIEFLKQAKKYGDFLFVLLESNLQVKKLKGKDRPINSQIDRAEILASVEYVDYVVLLDRLKNNKDYDEIVTKLNPNVIAVTKGSSQIVHAKRQGRLINAKVVSVIKRINNKSTSKLAKLILEKFNS